MQFEEVLIKELSDCLSQYRQEIAIQWIEEIYNLHEIQIDKNDIERIQLVSFETFDKLVYRINSKSVSETEPSEFSRLIDGFSTEPADLVEIFWLLSKIVRPYCNKYNQKNSAQLITLFDSILSHLSFHLIKGFYKSLLIQTEQARQQTVLITDLINSVGSTLDLFEVLDMAGVAIAKAAKANHCFFYLITNESELSTALPSMMSWPQIFSSPKNQIVTIGPHFLNENDAVWQVLKEKKPIQIYDAQNDSKTTHVSELRSSGVKSFLLIPCLAKGNVTAVAVISLFDHCREFTWEEIDLSLTIATIIAPSIENSRLYQKVEALAGLAERARLAREIHDNLAQDLGVMLLKASEADNLLENDQFQLARSNLDELNTIAKEAYTDIREVIFHLRSNIPTGEAFLTYLKEYLSTYQSCFHIHVDLRVEESPTNELDEKISNQILYIIQEALSNIRKHARATKISINLSGHNDGMQVDVEDNGNGFNLGKIDQEQKWHHFGLEIMQERAAVIGGTLTVSSKPGHGTLVRLVVPFS